ncbi:hypothetical protein FEM33_24155 [Dyadobacter flavalbus]|uniref:Uncharacterized protein n=1 Tax=Dyadobacter flavalbus TaxID=2579942 RepID=A0A5M8QA12_9BACT|nr:hypothetical protein [Dyadobacter flavalbus]KAA6432805.1 hypothetical protein FEM33_24155 [Dyadobacter flavalbus]
MKMKFSLFVVLAGAALGCVDIPDFDDTPKIYYNGVSQYTTTNEKTGKKEREYVTVTVDFEDGNGDLGATSEEIGNPAFTEPYGEWGNYELVTYLKAANGTWQEQPLESDKYKWVPPLKPDGKPGPIKGKLDFNANFPYFGSFVMRYVKFKVRIRDRALHVSNQIETDSILVPIVE